MSLRTPRKRKLPAVLSEYAIPPARRKPRISAGKALLQSSPLPKVTLKSGSNVANIAGLDTGSARSSFEGQQDRSSGADAKIATETHVAKESYRVSKRQHKIPLRFKTEETRSKTAEIQTR